MKKIKRIHTCFRHVQNMKRFRFWYEKKGKYTNPFPTPDFDPEYDENE